MNVAYSIYRIATSISLVVWVGSFKINWTPQTVSDRQVLMDVHTYPMIPQTEILYSPSSALATQLLDHLF